MPIDNVTSFSIVQ
jgi:hypothetical protein